MSTTFGVLHAKMCNQFNTLVGYSSGAVKCDHAHIQQVAFAGHKYRLFLDHYVDATEEGQPEWVGHLVETTSGMFKPGEIKPATKDMMGFRRKVGSNTVDTLGHGYMPDVVDALQELIDQIEIVVNPARELIAHVRDKLIPPGKLFTLDVNVQENICRVSFNGTSYEVTVYHGPVCSHPPAKINMGFNKDLLALVPVRVRGSNDIVKRTMDAVLQGVTTNKFSLVNEVIKDG